jgi:uncharacterized protein (DUF433 family)
MMPAALTVPYSVPHGMRAPEVWFEPEPSCRPGKLVLAYPKGVAYERITINPDRMSGLPCIRDTRVTVSAVLGQLAAGRGIEEIVIDYPYLERDDVLAALEFAAAAVQERELPLARPA